jgi:GMP synthase (glutamine-hydrolysing)
MQVLVIENYPKTPLGLVGEALREANVGWTGVAAHEGARVPDDPKGHAGLVVLGGVQNATDDAGYPFLPDVCQLIRRFHQVEKPVLGICLGAQLIARAFGARNILDRPVEFGWHDVRPTPAGREEPFARFLGEGAPLFHWHTDTFTLPGDAVHLASSDSTAHQAFRIGRSTYGIQFHFEAGTEVVKDWSASFADEIMPHTPDWQARLPEEISRHGDAADRTGLALARAWVELLGN